MRTQKYLLLIAMVSLTNSLLADSKAANLRCEFLINPIGIDTQHPRLTWSMNDNRRGALQSAYQIFVGTDSAQVCAGIGDLWATGKINSGDMETEYNGSQLKPFTHYFWIVKIWDNWGITSSESNVAGFETGMMETKNWSGSWISDSRDIHLKPAPLFRKTFNINRKILSARAYVAAAGLFELYINGQKIGDHRLDPMYTRFDRRTLYVTHDLTQLVKSGENAVGVMLGNGWYNHQSTAVWYFDQAPWRARPRFCLEIRITYSDGTVETIASGTEWKTSLGSVVFNSIYTGEHVDGRLFQPGWNSPGFDDSKWGNAIPVNAPALNIVAETLHPIRDVEEITTKKMTKISDSHYIFDLGRNISGVSQLKVNGTEGTVIRLKHGERLGPDGMVDQSNIDVHYRPTDQLDPFGTDIYTLRGDGDEIFKPRFNYKGFQYVEVISDKPVVLKKES